MVSIAAFKEMAMALNEVVELPHFERTSFRVNKKIFATLDIQKKLVCLMLSEIDQSAFSTYDPKVIYPVPNKWGLKGATYVELAKVRKEVLKDALQVAHKWISHKSPLE